MSFERGAKRGEMESHSVCTAGLNAFPSVITWEIQKQFKSMFSLRRGCLLRTAALSGAGRVGILMQAKDSVGFPRCLGLAGGSRQGPGRGGLPGAPRNISGLEAGSSATAPVTNQRPHVPPTAL